MDKEGPIDFNMVVKVLHGAPGAEVRAARGVPAHRMRRLARRAERRAEGGEGHRRSGVHPARGRGREVLHESVRRRAFGERWAGNMCTL